MAEGALTGRVILIVEDEYFAATDLQVGFVHAGATVVGPVPSLDKAMAVIEDTPRIDGAVLDINLGGEMVFPAADRIRERGVPFVFMTGYDQSVIPPRFGKVVRCEKPIGADKLILALVPLISQDPI